MLLHIKDEPVKALCCACRHLYVPTQRELEALRKPGRAPMCDACYQRAIEQSKQICRTLSERKAI